MNARDRGFIAAVRVSAASVHLETASEKLEGQFTLVAAASIRAAMCELAFALEQLHTEAVQK